MKVILTDEALESLEDLVLFLAETRGEDKAVSIGRA
jgi:plasmid stabilization system protein ParE